MTLLYYSTGFYVPDKRTSFSQKALQPTEVDGFILSVDTYSYIYCSLVSVDIHLPTLCFVCNCSNIFLSSICRIQMRGCVERTAVVFLRYSFVSYDSLVTSKLRIPSVACLHPPQYIAVLSVFVVVLSDSYVHIRKTE